MRKKLLLVVISTLIGLLLLEGGVRLYYGIKDRLPPHPNPATRDEWDWIRTHETSRIPASEAMAGFDAKLGWRLSADIDGWLRQKGHGLPQVTSRPPQIKSGSCSSATASPKVYTLKTMRTLPGRSARGTSPMRRF